MMKIHNRYSVAEWLKQVGGTCRRFPVAVLLLAFLSLFLINYNHGGDVNDKWWFFFAFYPSTGALLAVSLQLLTEDFKHRWAGILTQVVVHLLWMGVSLYLTQFDRFSMPQFVAVSATVVTMGLSMFLLGFHHKGDDVQFWNFALRLMVALVAGLVVGGILTLGLILFLQSLDWLFGINSEPCFADIPSVCMVLLAPMLTMSLIPAGKEKHIDHVVPLSGFLKGVVQYLFIPLLLLYMVTLYIYEAKILYTWQLPVGWVCYLVTASMLGMLVVIFVTLPLQHEAGNSVFKKVTRWLPLAMLPLLVLMSVAIGRRLSDYGITVDRLYMLVFNIWCYVVCIGLLLTRNKRLWWIPASFAVVLFLISVGPQGIPNMTQRHLLTQVGETAARSGITRMPMTVKQYDEWLQSLDDDVAKMMDSKLYYLLSNYGVKSIAGIVEDEVNVGLVCHYDRIQEAVVDEAPQSVEYRSYDRLLFNNVEIPRGFTHMERVQGDEIIKMEDGKVTFDAYVINDGNALADTPFRFEVSIKEFADRADDRQSDAPVKPLVVNNGREVLIVDNFYISLLPDTCLSIDVAGLLLRE